MISLHPEDKIIDKNDDSDNNDYDNLDDYDSLDSNWNTTKKNFL